MGPLSRRKFLKLGSAAAVVVVVAGVGGYFALQQPSAPSPAPATPTPQTVTAPESPTVTVTAPPPSPATPTPTPPTPTPTLTPTQILRVPEDYPTINEAVAAASPDDTIQVGPGVFPPFNINKPITVTGAGIGVSIIRAERAEGTFDSGVAMSSGASVSGFAIEFDIEGVPAILISGNRNRVSGNTIDSAGVGILIAGEDNEISDNTITSDFAGVSIFSFRSTQNKVSNNTINAGTSGVAIADSKNQVVGNSIEAGGSGVIVLPTTNNEIRGNTIRLCAIGIAIGGEENTIFENNLIDNETQAEDDGSDNKWFKDGTGNYWSDWTSPDENSDGIVDKPYAIAGKAGSVDRFPLVSPFQAGGQQVPPPAAVKSFTFTVQDKQTPWALVMNGEANPTITVNVGDTVEIIFTNGGQLGHTWNFDAGSPAPYDVNFRVFTGASDTVRFVADKPGTFSYYCAVPGHRDLGMTGQLIVS